MNYAKYCGPSRCVRALKPDELPPLGAHLITPFLGYTHHGIYVGDGKVVHYGALMYDLIRKPVEEVTLQMFAEGRPLYEVMHAEAAFDSVEVIRRARTRLGEKRYRLLTNNCEHFVEWCLHGVHRSFQAETALAYPRMLGEWIEGSALRFLRRLFNRASAGIPAIPTRAPAAVSGRESCDRSGRNPARTHTDIDSPCS
jgi:hypothetical protein